MSQDEIKEIVRAAISEHNKELVKSRKKKILHNTKILLKNLNKIKSSVEEAISESSQIEYTEDEIYINSIRKSKIRSAIVISHIERALDIVKAEYIEAGQEYKYDAFYDCLINGVSVDDAAELYPSSRASINRWIVEVTRAVSIQIFGVAGLELLIC